MKFLSDNIKPVLGLIIISAGIVYFFICLDINREPNGAMIGLVSMAAGYYFGSSTGTAKKDETISDLAKKQ